MIVVMAYHTLVEKNPNQVNKTWKYGTICILLISTAASAFVSFSLNALMASFNSNCILNTYVLFGPSESQPDYSRIVDSENSTDEVIFSKEKYDLWLHDRLQKIKLKVGDHHTDEEKDFLVKNTIAETTHWHAANECDWPLHVPLFFAFISVVWTTFFMMCGHGGASSGFLSSPWKIVLPSIICFSLMTIGSLIYLTSLNRGMYEFCRGFKEALPSLSCSEMLDIFQSNTEMEYSAGYHYRLMAIFVWVLFGSWATVLCIMVMRLVLTVDFELVNVKVMTLDQRTSERLKSKIVNNEPSDIEAPLNLKNNPQNLDAIVQVYPVVDDPEREQFIKGAGQLNTSGPSTDSSTLGDKNSRSTSSVEMNVLQM